MRILVLTADYPPIHGGISSVALHTSRELANMGHEVTVVAPYFDGQEEFDQTEPVDVVRFKGYRLGWFRFLPMILTAFPLIQNTELILGINVSHGGLIARLSMPFFHKPYITFAYAYEFLRFGKATPAACLLRWIYSASQKVVAISNFTRDRLVDFGVKPNHIDTIFPGSPEPNFYSPEKIAAIKKKYVIDTEHVILAVGRFVARKGQMTLVQAMPKILKRFPDALLIMVGEGPYLSSAVKKTHDLNVREQVLFPGHLPEEDVAGLYQACEVFALPTGEDKNGQVEGFGLVFTEAQAYGKPVVAGRSGGVVDAVIDEKTGLIVDPQSPDQLAEAIIRLMEDKELANRLGEQGRERIKQELNWTCFTKGILEISKKMDVK